MMMGNDKKSQKNEIVILAFDCEEFNSPGSAIKKAKNFSETQICGAREIWSVKKVIYWSNESQCLAEEEIDKVILFFYGEKYKARDELLLDPSIMEFLKCTKNKIFITEEKIPWPAQEKQKLKIE
jgi:hypothetical protein